MASSAGPRRSNRLRIKQIQKQKQHYLRETSINTAKKRKSRSNDGEFDTRTVKRRKIETNSNNSIHDLSYPIFVKTIISGNSRTLSFVVKDFYKIDHILCLISDKLKIHTKNVILLYDNKKLSEDKSLEYYKISRDSTLTATMRRKTQSVQGLLDQIKSIDSQIKDQQNMHSEQIHHLTSIDDVNNLMIEIRGSFNAKIHKLHEQKLQIYPEIHSILKEQYEASFRAKQSAQRQEINFIERENNKIDEEMHKLQAMIQKLEKDKDLNTKRVQELERTINESEIGNIRKQKCDDIKDKMNEIKRDLNKDMSFMLDECVMNKWKQFELEYKEWNEKDFISWLKYIEKGKFDDEKYREFITRIEKLKIDGSKMKDVNETLLAALEFDDGDQRIMMRNIERVINHNAAPKNTICMICVRRQINTTYDPCGHQAICFQCYAERPHNFMTCMICREEVDQVIQTFMAGHTE